MNYLDKILKLVKQGRIKTKYSHHNRIYRRLRSFIFSVDCSGLMEFWLSKSYPSALSEIYNFVYQVRSVSKSEIKRLYSFDFYDFFCSIANSDCPNWQVIKLEEPLKRGDVIAFINPKTTWRFGHVAVVDEEISRSKNKITIRIIDSSQIEHIEDYRQSSKYGIGCGIIELIYQSEEMVSVNYGVGNTKLRSVKIGRLKKDC